MSPSLDRPKKYFLEKLEIFSNIKIDAKFDCGSNAHTLRLWESLSEAPGKKVCLFSQNLQKPWDLEVNFADLLCNTGGADHFGCEGPGKTDVFVLIYFSSETLEDS